MEYRPLALFWNWWIDSHRYRCFSLVVIIEITRFHSLIEFVPCAWGGCFWSTWRGGRSAKVKRNLWKKNVVRPWSGNLLWPCTVSATAATAATAATTAATVTASYNGSFWQGGSFIFFQRWHLFFLKAPLKQHFKDTVLYTVLSCHCCLETLV